jgi:hypothetical protein
VAQREGITVLDTVKIRVISKIILEGHDRTSVRSSGYKMEAIYS